MDGTEALLTCVGMLCTGLTSCREWSTEDTGTVLSKGNSARWLAARDGCHSG